MSPYLLLLLAFAPVVVGEEPAIGPDPEVAQLVSQISVERIAAIQKKLESFGTRNIYTAGADSEHGIGAAREWIAEQLKSYGPRLEVWFDKHRLAAQGRAFRNVEIWNIVARLPGAAEPDRQVIASAHYDTINLISKNGPNGTRELDGEATAAAPAPGVTDDGSGTAAVMELARVMSQRQFRKSIVFILFAAEEYGLLGSGLYAEQAKARGDQIEAVFNNDIIGSDVNGVGTTTTRYVNLYSEEPNDSSSRQLARYIRETSRQYLPGFDVSLVFRHDRFGRGGDHSPFNAAGYAAVRFTTAEENFSHQHTESDTFANTAPNYTWQVTKVNAAGIGNLALGPATPRIVMTQPGPGRAFASPLGRGKSGYDAEMHWTGGEGSELTGYEIVMRATTAPEWQQTTFVGNTSTYTLPNVNIDEVALGVRAVDRAGHRSLVAAFVNPPYVQRKIATY